MQLLQARWNHSIEVDVSVNQPHSVAAVALLDEVATRVGGTLFHQSTILCKAWMKCELKIVGGSRGLLSSHCLRTLLLNVFARHVSRIETPIDALILLIEDLAHFDWRSNVFSVFGPFCRNAWRRGRLVHAHVVAREQGDDVDAIRQAWYNVFHDDNAVITPQLLAYFSNWWRYAVKRYGSLPKHELPSSGLPVRMGAHDHAHPEREEYFLNVLDPLDMYNNLGRSVSVENSDMVQQLLRASATRLLSDVRDVSSI
ncbi:MAG: hypothetical protein MHM6MM_007620 [Cercozoa sp. M6MM]